MEPSIGLWVDSSLKRRACICISSYRREKTYRKKGRMKEQDTEKERERKRKREKGWRSGPHLPSHLGINPVARI